MNKYSHKIMNNMLIRICCHLVVVNLLVPGFLPRQSNMTFSLNNVLIETQDSDTIEACFFFTIFAFASCFVFVVEDKLFILRVFVIKPNGYSLTYRALLSVVGLFSSSILFPL